MIERVVAEISPIYSNRRSHRRVSGSGKYLAVACNNSDTKYYECFLSVLGKRSTSADRVLISYEIARQDVPILSRRIPDIEELVKIKRHLDCGNRCEPNVFWFPESQRLVLDVGSKKDLEGIVDVLRGVRATEKLYLPESMKRGLEEK